MKKKKSLRKDIKKSITHSWGRFFSIMALMALGSFALVELSITGPDMRKTGENYFQEYKTADITVIGDYGLDTSEIDKIQSASNIKEVEYIYLKDIVEEGTNTSFRIFSSADKISMYELVEGKVPETDDEIAIDTNNQEKYNIGDTISFKETEDAAGNTILKRTEFKIVGFINSTEILSTLNRGETTIGTGALNCYGIINKNNFDSDVYMMAKLLFTDTDGLDPYSDEYNDRVIEHKKQLEDLLEEQKGIRFSSIKSEYKTGVKTLEDAKKELEEKESEYYEKLQEYNEKEPDAQKEIADGEKELADAQKELDELESPIYQVDNRREIPGGEGYEMYQKVSNIIDSLAKIFPLFMYFVAALVTLTTMTRFVDEERINMGTYKALGYKDKDIVKKFVIYGFLASSVGTIIGVLLGHFLIPYIAYNAYRNGFSTPMNVNYNFWCSRCKCINIYRIFSTTINIYYK